MIYGNPPVNDLHKALRIHTEQDPTCETALAFAQGVINVRGYDAVKSDPGMYAWIMENSKVLRPRAMRGRSV
jgi:hypothetical protein